MITYMLGNLFESPAQTLVNTVNTVGVMGKGIALQFKRFYPDMFREYQQLCETGQLEIGRLFLYRTRHKLILNFPTKTDWRKPSRLEYIEKGLQTFVDSYEKAGIYSVAFPPLGCGNGELNYSDVRPMMERYLAKLPIPIFLYPPLQVASIPEHRNEKEIKRWLKQQPQDMSFREVWRDVMDQVGLPVQLKTLTSGKPFSVELIKTIDDFHVRVRAGRTVHDYDYDHFHQIWRDLRAHGLATTRTAGGSDGRFLFPILALLPYVRAVQVAESFDELSYSKSWALQLVPAKGEQQQSLALQG